MIYRQLIFSSLEYYLRQILFFISMKNQTKISNQNVSLLFLNKIVRALSYGIIIVVYFDNLFLKGIGVFPSAWIQVAIIAGNIVFSQLLIFYASIKGPINALILASIIQFLTGVIYAESDSATIMTLMSCFGTISLTTGQMEPFQKLEKCLLGLDQGLKQGNESSRNSKCHFALGWISSALGAILVGYFMSVATSYDDTMVVIMRLYAGLALLNAFLYFFMSRSFNHVQLSKPSQQYPEMLTQDIMNVFIFGFSFVICGVSDSFLLLNFISFYLEDELFVPLQIVALCIAVLVLFWGIGSTFSQFLSSRTSLMFILSGLLGVLMFFLPKIKNFYVAMVILSLKSFLQLAEERLRINVIADKISSCQAQRSANIGNNIYKIGLAFGVGWKGYLMGPPTPFPGNNWAFYVSGCLRLLYIVVLSLLFKICQSTLRSAELISADQFESEKLKEINISE